MCWQQIIPGIHQKHITCFANAIRNNIWSVLHYLYFIKFRWAFRMYDKDNSGSIELGEMIEIIGTLYEMEGVSKVIVYL